MRFLAMIKADKDFEAGLPPDPRLMEAIEAVTARRIHTPDLGGEATTEVVTAAVCDALKS